MKSFVSFILGFLFVIFQMTVGNAAQRWEVNPQASRIAFSARSTLHPVHGVAKQMDGYIDEDATALTGQISAATDALDTENFKRDRNMKKMLRMLDYPQIVFKVESIVHGQSGRNDQIKGKLSIGGKSQEIQVDVQRKQDGDVMRLSGTFPVSLSVYELHPPSVIGIIRVGDRVEVEFDVAFSKTEGGKTLP